MKKRRQKLGFAIPKKVLFYAVLLILASAGGGWYHFVLAEHRTAEPVPMELDLNLGLRPYTEEFLRSNGAEELIPIIACESNFQHFEADGQTLKNRVGSSAIGIAQIMSSLHPDPKLIKKYNRLMNTRLTIDDLDITTVRGNLGYALILYQLHGTRDWECAKYL